MKRPVVTLALVLSLSIFGVLVWLVVARGGIRRGFADSAPLAEWLVALGTSGLAVATVLLAREARNEAIAVREEAEQVRRQVEVEAEQLVAAQRPLVMPVMGEENTHGTRHVMLKNAGVGPAMNFEVRSGGLTPRAARPRSSLKSWHQVMRCRRG